MTTENVEQTPNQTGAYLAEHGGQLVIAIVVLVLGFKLIFIFRKKLVKILEHKKVEKRLIKIGAISTDLGLRTILILLAASFLGIDTTSIIVAIVAILALVAFTAQDTLANLGSGLIIIILHPYKVGDYIEVQGQKGTVKEIHLFNTKIVTNDNKTIYIPNSIVTNTDIKNYYQQKTRRVDIKVRITYDSDLKKAKEIMVNQMKAHADVHNSPAPRVVLRELEDRGLFLSARCWVNSRKYWEVYYSLIEEITESLKKGGVQFPVPLLEGTTPIIQEKA